MKKLFIIVFATMGLCLSAVSCSDDDGNINPDPGPMPLLPSDIVVIVENWNDFGFNLLKESVNSSEFANTNFILSPVGVTQTYSMLANETGGELHRNIITALGYEDLNIEQVNQLNKKIMDCLKKDNASAVLCFANSVWTTPDISLSDDFRSASDLYYGAEMNGINGQTFVSDINSWCNNSTDGNIDAFIDDIVSLPDISVGNVVYFTGKWSIADNFDVTRITDGYFTEVNGTRSSVKFLRNKKDMQYYETSTMQKCTLNFGEHSFAVTLVLPKEGVTLSQTVDALTDGGWKRLWNEENDVVVDLSLPKFRVENEIDLEKLLPAFGIADIFGASSNGHVSIAKQKNVFELTEQNTPSIPGYIPDIKTSSDHEVKMTFDRPFIYVVYEQSTNAILFVGCVNTFAN